MALSPLSASSKDLRAALRVASFRVFAKPVSSSSFSDAQRGLMASKNLTMAKVWPRVRSSS